jgi:hypothetical protein
LDGYGDGHFPEVGRHDPEENWAQINAAEAFSWMLGDSDTYGLQ